MKANGNIVVHQVKVGVGESFKALVAILESFIEASIPPAVVVCCALWSLAGPFSLP